MLGKYFEGKGHNVIYAKADADTLIVKTVLKLSEEKHVTVVADDTVYRHFNITALSFQT